MRDRSDRGDPKARYYRPLQKLAGILCAAALAACAAYQAQHVARPAAAPEDEQTASVKPSGEYSELTPDGKVARVRGEVSEVKAQLHRQGKYECCVLPACTECLLKHGECHCADVVRESGPCCGECTESWIEGKGAIEGVDAWELLQRKIKVLQDKNKPQGETKPPAVPPPHGSGTR
jgi:hypothetical protein